MVRRETKQIIRDGNKTIHLIQKPNMVNVRMRVRGTDLVIVSGPRHCTFDALWGFYKRYEQAADRQLLEAKKANVMPARFSEGETLLWQGMHYPLHLSDSDLEIMDFREGAFDWRTKHTVPTEASLQAGLKAYKSCLRLMLEAYAMKALVPDYPDVTVQVKPYVAKWGLCRPDRRQLVLNLTLAVLPARLTDYVISHELAHFDVPNHSSAFFERLAELEPDWRCLRQELQSHCHVQVR